MVTSVKAIFEQGVFRPLEPVALDEQQEVVLSVETAPATALPRASALSALTVAQQLGLIGCAVGLPDDLSTNPHYFDGFGTSS